MTVEAKVLDLFKVMVKSEDHPSPDEVSDLNFGFISLGVVTDFIPTKSQKMVLFEKFDALPIRTLFSAEERTNESIFNLLRKQCLHYYEVYGLHHPGLFELEVSEGTTTNIVYVKGVTQTELSRMVRDLLYSNAPIKDVVSLTEIIKYYDISYSVDMIKNNEAKIALFDCETDRFSSGDDVVRYICFKATGSPLLIKSNEVIELVKILKSSEIDIVLKNHERQLAEVFNRHKRIILALKNKNNRNIINRISRLSKTKHVPLREHPSKSYIRKSFLGENDPKVLESVSIRDKMKFLNLLEYKKLKRDYDFFHIRNGKVHYEPNRIVYDEKDIRRLEEEILESLAKDLGHLREKRIVLDENVDYGLPISRKQTLGNLPYGTEVNVSGSSISSGIYWRNEWGATDLDLSIVDINGMRTGWGSYRSYSDANEIIFSGDITSAPDGAMEFMTSKSSYKNTYGLFVNVYSGDPCCSMELVVGSKSNKDKWIDNCIIREKVELKSRGSVVGFVKDGKFIVYSSRLNNSRVSEGNTIISRVEGSFWTVSKLLDRLNISYSTKKDIDTDYDLSYNEFTYQKLEDLLLNK